MQPIAARRAGKASPWHDQPEIRKLGSSRRLRKPRQEPRVGVARLAKQRHRAELAVDDAGRFQFARARRIHARGDVGDGGPVWPNSPPGR